MSRVTPLDQPAAQNPARASTPHKSPLPPRRHRGLWITLTAIVVMILVFRLVASPLATNLLNRKLSSMPDYHGNVGAVKIALWRAGAEIDDLVLYSKDGDGQTPIVKVKKAGMRVAWSPLLRGKIAGELKAENPEIAIVTTEESKKHDDGKSAKEKVQEMKAKIDPWREALQKAFPMELTRLEVNEAKFRFIDRTKQPNPEVSLEHVHILATGLRNRNDGEELPAKLTIQGVTTGNGKLMIQAQADPMAKTPRFEANMDLTGLYLPACNNFLEGFANADVSSGTFDFFIQATGKNGGYEGYVKPFLKDLKFKTVNKPVVEKVVKSAANAVVKILKNQDEQKVATKAPFSGTFDQTGVDVWTTIQNLFRNAFVRALREGFEGGGAKG